MVSANGRCCGELTVKQGAILVGCFSLLGTILWLAWETYQLVYLEQQINYGDGACTPNPCLHGGFCLVSDNVNNRHRYVCDCFGTGFEGINCNASRVRTGHKRSCADWWQDGQRRNGVYLIDPDGPDANTFDPFPVRCEFEERRAYTTVVVKPLTNLDDVAVGPVTGDKIQSDVIAKSPFDMTYLEYYTNDAKALSSRKNAPPDTHNNGTVIDWLVRESHHCEQEVTFTCKQYDLAKTDNTAHNLVLGRDDAYYMPSGHRFPGLGQVDASSTYYCACYENLTCATKDDTYYRCNCNSNSETRVEDVLTLTKREHAAALPVKAVQIEATMATVATDAEFGFEVSDLRCWDEFKAPLQHSRWPNGGYGSRGRPYHGEFLEHGFEIMWGVIIAFTVVTALLLIASIILIIAAVNDHSAPMFIWVIMILLMNLMVLIVLIIRWYYLGFNVIIWEVAVAVVWITLTFYGLFAVVAFFGAVSRGQIDRD